MEAQAILPVRTSGVLKQENASRDMNDIFRAILRENETRELATRGETARTDASRDPVEYDAERPTMARRRSDAAHEARDDDRYSDTREERPVAEDIRVTDESVRRDHTDKSQPRANRPDQSAESDTAKTDTQEHDDAPLTSDTLVETGLGDEGAPMLAASAIAANPALAGNPAIAATPFTQVTDGVAAQAPATSAALKPANPKDALSSAPRPAVIPTAVAGPQAALDGAVATPVLGEAETAPAPATVKTIQSTLPVVPAEAAIPLNAAQVKRTQSSGQKVDAPAVSTEAPEIVGPPDKDKQASTAARIQLDLTGHKATASAASVLKDPAASAEANQAARANPALVPPSLETPGQRTPVASDTATAVLKTAASAGNTGQAPAGLTGIDPMQAATRTADVRPGSAPTTDRPVPPNEVTVTIQRAAARGDDRIRIRLHPAELGQVDVRLKVGADGIVRAMVQVDRPETLDLMQRDARGLERALQDAGLKTDSGSLSFNLRDNGEDGLRDRDGDGDTSMAGREQADADLSAAIEAAEIPVHTGRSSRALDIRV